MSQLERERLGIPPHHVGMDPNDPLVSLLIPDTFAAPPSNHFCRKKSLDNNAKKFLSSSKNQQQPDAAGFQLPREFVFALALYDYENNSSKCWKMCCFLVVRLPSALAETISLAARHSARRLLLKAKFFLCRLRHVQPICHHIRDRICFCHETTQMFY